MHSLPASAHSRSHSLTLLPIHSLDYSLTHSLTSSLDDSMYRKLNYLCVKDSVTVRAQRGESGAALSMQMSGSMKFASETSSQNVSERYSLTLSKYGDCRHWEAGGVTSYTEADSALFLLSGIAHTHTHSRQAGSVCGYRDTKIQKDTFGAVQLKAHFINSCCGGFSFARMSCLLALAVAFVIAKTNNK